MASIQIDNFPILEHLSRLDMRGRSRRKPFILLVFVLLMFSAGTASLTEAAIFFGPTSYLSTADIPAGFYASGSPAFLEDFEDGSLDGGITASTTSSLLSPVVRAPAPTTDSVDADDGTIDGSGTGGHSFRFDTDVTLTFAAPVTAAGMVWTDGGSDFIFEAFGSGMVSLGTLNFSRPTAPFTGETDEDVFVGATDSVGIVAIKLSGVSGSEVDHIQFGIAPTEVEIDIKPGSFPNSINLGSNGNVPVAIFSNTTFDATTVDAATVTLASASVKLKGKANTPMASQADVNGDGLLDLVVHVDTTALVLSETDTQAILEGQTTSGQAIAGADSIRIVPQTGAAPRLRARSKLTTTWARIKTQR